MTTGDGRRTVIPALLGLGKLAAIGIAGLAVFQQETTSPPPANGGTTLFLSFIALLIALVSALPQIVKLFKSAPKPTREELELATLEARKAEAEAEAERLRHDK